MLVVSVLALLGASLNFCQLLASVPTFSCYCAFALGLFLLPNFSHSYSMQSKISSQFIDGIILSGAHVYASLLTVLLNAMPSFKVQLAIIFLGISSTVVCSLFLKDACCHSDANRVAPYTDLEAPEDMDSARHL